MFIARPKTVLVLLALAMLIASCKKDHNDPGGSNLDYYIKFTLDGTDVLYINNAEGNMNVVSGGKYTFSGTALKVANTAGSNNATLSVSNTTEITTNVTYVNYTTTTAGFQRAVLSTVSYIDAAGTVFNSWGDEFASQGVVSNSKINFTEITTTSLRGTFSGTSYKSISGTAEKHLITKGEFNLKRR